MRYARLKGGASWSADDIPYDALARDRVRDDMHLFYTVASASFIEITSDLYTYNLIDAYWNAKPTMRVAMMDYDAPVKLSLLPEGGFKMDATVLRF